MSRFVRKSHSHWRDNGTPKRGYVSKAEAEQEAARRQPYEELTELTVYHCRKCGRFHVGSST